MNVLNFIACRSKLASLFGMDSTVEPSSNESLTYKAPTEPKKKSFEGLLIVLTGLICFVIYKYFYFN